MTEEVKRKISATLKGRKPANFDQWVKAGRIATTGIKHSEEWIKKRTAHYTSDKHYRWVGDKASYHVVHNWINSKYGQATQCKNPDCLNLSTTFHWAKKTNREYTRDPKDYIQLCVRCHSAYDKGRLKLLEEE